MRYWRHGERFGDHCVGFVNQSERNTIAMNAAREQKYAEVGYRVNDVCEDCAGGHFMLARPTGVCLVHEVAGLGGKPRSMLVHRSGSCPSFRKRELDE